MPAFTYTAAKIRLSFSYDGMTVYASQYNWDLMACLDQMADNPFMCFKDNVFRDDSSHYIYHNDQNKFKDDHVHSKFKKPIDIALFTKLINHFESYQILTKQESNDIKNLFQQRYANLHHDIQSLMKYEADSDLKTIHCFILTCCDHDLLVSLHSYLSTKEFDYLRRTGNNDPLWCAIERAITLQMVINFNNKVTSPAMLSQVINELIASHSFFCLRSTAPLLTRFGFGLSQHKLLLWKTTPQTSLIESIGTLYMNHFGPYVAKENEEIELKVINEDEGNDATIPLLRNL